MIENNLPIAEYLIRNGAKANEKNKDGNTPLHFAVYYNPALAIDLMEIGADPLIQNKDQQTPLSGALKNKNLNLAFLLTLVAEENYQSILIHNPYETTQITSYQISINSAFVVAAELGLIKHMRDLCTRFSFIHFRFFLKEKNALDVATPEALNYLKTFKRPACDPVFHEDYQKPIKLNEFLKKMKK